MLNYKVTHSADKVVFIFMATSFSDCMSCFFSVAPQPTADGSVQPGKRRVHSCSPGAGDITVHGE